MDIKEHFEEDMGTISQNRSPQSLHTIQADLLEREQQYRSIFESVSDGLFINRLADGKLVDMNPAAASMHGYTLEEFRHLQPVDFIHPDSLHVFQEYIDTVQSGGIFRGQAVDVHKDGSLFHVDVLGTYFTYKGEPHTLAIVRDIEHQVESFQALEKRVEERTKQLHTQHAELTLALANQEAAAIENARLFQTVQRGADQFRAISELGQRITSILDTDELLTQTVHLIQNTFGYFHVHIGLIEGDVVVFPATAGVFAPDPVCNFCAPLRLRVGHDGICGWVAGTGEPLLVPDLSQDARYIRPLGAIGSGVVVPLKVKSQVIGILDVENRQVNAFDQSDVAVLQLLANQVAVAIENARLYKNRQELAALQERQKLARELHDSVSQALYGIGLGARAAQKMLDLETTHKEDLVQPLEYVLSLAEAGLAEMRALIFELRPDSLENEGIVAALSKQAAALEARHNIRVDASLADEPDLPLDVKQTLYRIAQEAMQNIMKHAGASQILLKLEVDTDFTSLEIEDNGIGFEPQGTFPGHLGLKSMRERADGIGGQLTIESTSGLGTRVTVIIPLSR